MAKYYVPAPDGSTVVVNAPDGASEDQVMTYAKKLYSERAPQVQSQPQQKEPMGGLEKAARFLSPVSPESMRDLGAGLIRGAGSIGATFARPFESGEENQQRRTRIDENARNLIGADTDSFMYGAGKIGGEVAGTAGIGGALAKVPMALGANPAIVNAIRSAGMTTGLPRAIGGLQKATDIGLRMGAGGLVGGASAMAVDPKYGPQGAVIGALAPPAINLAGKTGQFIGQAFSNNMAKNAAVDKAAKAAGPNVQQIVGDIQTYYPKGAENIPLSAAAITQNPELAMLERASRTRSPASWQDFSQNQATKVFENVKQATDEVSLLGKRSAERRENWNNLWAAAEQSQKPRIWAQRMDKLMGDLDVAMQTKQSSNPAVRAALEEIRNDISRIGPNYTPGHLQQMRAQLNGKADKLAPNALKQADRSLPAIIDLKRELDDILSVSTGGKWDKVLSQYSKDSQLVDQSRAAGQIIGKYIDPNTGRVLGKTADAAGDVPVITESSLSQALKMSRNPADMSPRLSAPAQQRLDATVDALRKQDILQRMKNTGTGGGGSNTAMDLSAAGSMVNAPNSLMQLLGAVRSMGTGRTDRELAGLLSNPDLLANELSRYMAPQTAPIGGLLGARVAPVIGAQ